jgi:tetratricopeptide (TPR) repeat protein
MSEMLGNHHLLVGNFKEAQIEFEDVLLDDSRNDFIKKKLIICYTLAAKLEKALDLFLTLLSHHKEIFDCQDPFLDKQFCKEIISEYENIWKDLLDAEEYNLGLGILWFFCNTHVSIKCFQKAARFGFTDHRIKGVLQLVENYQNQALIDHKKKSSSNE